MKTVSLLSLSLITMIISSTAVASVSCQTEARREGGTIVYSLVINRINPSNEVTRIEPVGSYTDAVAAEKAQRQCESLLTHLVCKDTTRTELTGPHGKADSYWDEKIVEAQLLVNHKVTSTYSAYALLNTPMYRCENDLVDIMVSHLAPKEAPMPAR